MPVSIYDLSGIVVIHAVIQLSGLVVLISLGIRGHRQLTRLGRATAAMVYQESEKTRARVDEVLRQIPR
jgi:hypothetical protein